MDPAGVDRRRRDLLDMMKQDRRQRQSKGEDVSSSDEERDGRRVDEQIRVIATLYGKVTGREKLGTCTRAQNEEMEAVFLDHEGAQRRVEYMRRMLRQERSERRERGSDISSSDDEKDARWVEAQMQGMTRRPGESNRRTRAQNKELEALLMDPAGVDKRRQQLCELLREDRRARRSRGEDVSSSDEERDNRRVEAQLLGAYVEVNRSRGDGLQDAGRIEDALFVENPPWRRRVAALWSQSSARLALSPSQQGFTYTDSFELHGGRRLNVQSKSWDPRLLKQVREQKEILRAASGVSQALDGENATEGVTKGGADELCVAQQFSGVVEENESQEHAAVKGGEQKTIHEELQALQGSAARMKRVWQQVEAQKLGVTGNSSASFRKRGPGMYVVQDTTLSADVGIQGGSFVPSSPHDTHGLISPESFGAPAPDSKSPRAANTSQHQLCGFQVLKSLSSSNPAFLDVAAAPAMQERAAVSRSLSAADGAQASFNLVGHSTNTSSTLANEAKVQLELLKAHLSSTEDRRVADDEASRRKPDTGDGQVASNETASPTNADALLCRAASTEDGQVVLQVARNETTGSHERGRGVGFY